MRDNPLSRRLDVEAEASSLYNFSKNIIATKKLIVTCSFLEYAELS